MTILGHDDIKHYINTKNLFIENMNENSIRENGIDCKIGNEIAIDIPIEIKNYPDVHKIIDTHDEESIHKRFEIRNFNGNNSFVIPPHTNVLLVTEEVFRLPNNIMALCCLRSTVARNGFVAPITIVDAGFEGTLTIETFYGGNNPIKIYKGDRFMHVVFCNISSPMSKPYNRIYKGQKGVRLPKCMD